MLHSLRKIGKYLFSEHRYVIDKLILKRKARDVPKTEEFFLMERGDNVMQKKVIKLPKGNVKNFAT
jgi:hypothetical protein